MSFLVTVFLSLILAIGIKWLFKLVFKPANFPPGPPILSSTIGVLRNGSSTLLKFANSPEKVIGIIVGTEKYVFINDAKIAKKAFNREELTGKPQVKWTVNNTTLGGSYGLISK